MWIAVAFLVNSKIGHLVKIITFQTHSKEENCLWISFFCVIMSFVRDSRLLKVLGDSVRILILQDTGKAVSSFFNHYSLLSSITLSWV